MTLCQFFKQTVKSSLSSKCEVTCDKTLLESLSPTIEEESFAPFIGEKDKAPKRQIMSDEDLPDSEIPSTEKMAPTLPIRHEDETALNDEDKLDERLPLLSAELKENEKTTTNVPPPISLSEERTLSAVLCAADMLDELSPSVKLKKEKEPLKIAPPLLPSHQNTLSMQAVLRDEDILKELPVDVTLEEELTPRHKRS